MGITSHPLCWPVAIPRERGTHNVRRAVFKNNTRNRACQGLIHELELSGVGDWEIIVSSNVPVRRMDSLMRADGAEPDDPGVAVYFPREGVDIVIAIDRYDRVQDNVRALAKTVEALRGIRRCRAPGEWR